MDAQLLLVMCLSLALLYSQAEGQTMDTAEDAAKDRETKLADEVGFRGREVLAAPSSTADYNALVRGVHAASGRCASSTSQVKTWKKNYRVYCSFLTVSYKISKSSCCCACKAYSACVGVHYITNERKCIFHFGGTPKYDPEPGNCAWIKSTGVSAADDSVSKRTD